MRILLISAYFFLSIHAAISQCLNPDLKMIADGFELAEGPLWHNDGYLLFSDIDGNTIYKWTEEDSSLEVFLNPSDGANGLAFDADSNLIIAQSDSRRLVKLDSLGNISILADNYHDKQLSKPNDLVIKEDGSIIFTNPSFSIPIPSIEDGFYLLTPDSQFYLLDVLEGCNGIALSPDESKIYVNTYFTQQIYVWDFKDDTSVTNKRLFARGGADGMKTDLDGNVYACGNDDIYIYSPDGTLLNKIDITGQPTNINWKNRSEGTAFITTLSSVYELRKPFIFGQIGDVIFDPVYVSPNASVSIKTKITNPFDNSFTVKALITNDDETYKNTLSLLDDGLHGDDLAGDYIFANGQIVPDFESLFSVDIEIKDIKTGSVCISNSKSHFTSRGPVELDSYFSIDTVFNDRDIIELKLDIFLKNLGQTDTVKNVKINPVFFNPCTHTLGFRQPAFGDIAPAEIKAGNRALRLGFEDSCVTDIYSFGLQIISETDTFWTDYFDIPVNLENEIIFNAQKFSLSPNYPNPFNPTTTISYQIAKPTKVDLTIYDVTGREIKTLVNKRQPPDSYTLNFDGAGLPSGIYFYRLTTSAGFEKSRKMILLK